MANGIVIEFNPTALNRQTAIIPFATPFNDGAMSQEQAAKLAALVPGSSALPAYVVADRPAAAAMPNRLITYTDADGFELVQISLGGVWRTFALEAL